MSKIDKRVQRTKDVFNSCKTEKRVQWEYINQKGFDFANDNQVTEQERMQLEEQGMPTFTINRIIPVVEMLNFYATAKTPRWQAVGVDGSDSDIASVYSDVADYIWYHSKGDTLLSNAVNDSVTKSIGYLMVTVDSNADRGMGEVVIKQPDPFDIFVDNKSRDILFRDAAFILIRKILPKGHLIKLFPESKRKIMAASSDNTNYENYSEKSTDITQHDFHYKEMDNNNLYNEKERELLEFFELYEKEKIEYVNVFYQELPDKEKMNQIAEQTRQVISKMSIEFEVKFKETKLKFDEMLENGDILPERHKLELEKILESNQEQLKQIEIETMHRLTEEQSKTSNKIVTAKEFKILQESKSFANRILNSISFFEDRVKLTCVVGDKFLYENLLPITEYPLVPFHYKWTGTPFPMSAVSPLIGKQQELNKAHQLMVHNASLGSSLRWMYEEGSIDTDYWEKYSSAPGALLPKRSGFDAPQPVMPFQLNNAFFSLVQAGKGDMEYLAGVYSAMQGDIGASGDMPYRGMLAMDEYGTRRIKYWLKNSLDPALQQMGEIIKQYSQAVYTAHKVFNILQPDDSMKTVEINIPMYNDFGKIIGKWRDYKTSRFDVRIIAGSTMPVNRWAYLEELKQLMQLGVVDDMAVLAETDIKNKEGIAERKSMYAQMKGQIEEMERKMQDREGTIETLERQLVQAGIKNKVMQGQVEVSKQIHDTRSNVKKEELETKAMQKLLREAMKNDVKTKKEQAKAKMNNLQGK